MGLKPVLGPRMLIFYNNNNDCDEFLLVSGCNSSFYFQYVPDKLPTEKYATYTKF